ncbi:MAG: CAP domain-containing protein [Devosia sp.]|uniref:CAP domain-containing protein n=1 Tax=Devosia sp. TaxID=1871048 RepID=UPI001A3B2664|nr:CAP domain-containing protein [Devosia sp.]MBL8596362.1 CAP domain-containing protein [Devosia sp.]
MPLLFRSLLLAGMGLLLSACASVGPSIVPRSSTPPPQLTQASILSAINEARRANGGHKPMSYNVKLEAACKTQVALMIEKDQLAHDLGMKPRARTDQAGYIGAIGENLAGGQQTLEGAIEGWLNSSGHRATLLSDKFVEFGLAVARVPADRKSRYGIYWCFLAGGPFEAWQTVVVI